MGPVYPRKEQEIGIQSVKLLFAAEAHWASGWIVAHCKHNIWHILIVYAI